MKTIYELKLHETISLDRFIVTRVEGGWIYESNINSRILFVPYKDEFDPRVLERMKLEIKAMENMKDLFKRNTSTQVGPQGSAGMGPRGPQQELPKQEILLNDKRR